MPAKDMWGLCPATQLELGAQLQPGDVAPPSLSPRERLPQPQGTCLLPCGHSVHSLINLSLKWPLLRSTVRPVSTDRTPVDTVCVCVSVQSSPRVPVRCVRVSVENTSVCSLCVRWRRGWERRRPAE